MIQQLFESLCLCIYVFYSKWTTKPCHFMQTLKLSRPTIFCMNGDYHQFFSGLSRHWFIYWVVKQFTTTWTNTPNLTFEFSQYCKVMRKLFRANSHNKVLNIPRFLSFTRVTVTHWERLRVDECAFQCRPNLICRSEHGTMFPATADGITFSRATKTGKLRFILSEFTLQYVMIPDLSEGRENSHPQLKNWSSRQWVRNKKVRLLCCICRVDVWFSCYTLYITIYTWHN